MFKIAICDDDIQYLEYEKMLVEQCMRKCNMNYMIVKFSSGIELVKELNIGKRFDVIFLDVEMEGQNGLDTARKIRVLDSRVYIVFVTAFISYSLDGYGVNAFRYIIKERSYLERTLGQCIEDIVIDMGISREEMEFQFREGIMRLLPEDIIYIESMGHLVNFVLQGKEKGIIRTRYDKLDEIEKNLEQFKFCRIHKSYLINIRYVDKIEHYQVQLKNGKTLSVTRNRYTEVRRTIINFWGEIR